MPLFEVASDEIVPFRRVRDELYEREIEDLLWDNLEAFVGQPLLPVRRQAPVGGGLIPDVVAIDREGRVFVIEVKRDIDRRQLAQCLEYAGWARSTNLDELAGLFHGGADEFFNAWMEFTGTTSPRLIQSQPQLVLVARDLDTRTEGALSFLTDSDLAITVLRVSVYEDRDRRRFVEVDADHEPDFDHGTAPSILGPVHLKIDGRRITLADMIDAGLLQVGDRLMWDRPRIQASYEATVTEAGGLRLPDGREFASPSRAAAEAAGIGAFDGWEAWRRGDGRLLSSLRLELVERNQTEGTP